MLPICKCIPHFTQRAVIINAELNKTHTVTHFIGIILNIKLNIRNSLANYSLSSVESLLVYLRSELSTCGHLCQHCHTIIGPPKIAPPPMLHKANQILAISTQDMKH